MTITPERCKGVIELRQFEQLSSKIIVVVLGQKIFLRMQFYVALAGLGSYVGRSAGLTSCDNMCRPFRAEKSKQANFLVRPRLSHHVRDVVVVPHIIESLKSGQWYFGYSTELGRRLEGHNIGLNKSTRGRGPWRFIFIREFTTKAEALKFDPSSENSPK